jgi:hypothetical protein
MAALLAAPAASAHDPDEQFSAWFRSLTQPGTGISCCSPQRDCQQVDDYEADEVSGYRVKYDGVWVQVPQRVVIDRVDNPTGRAVLCISFFNGLPVARCFVRAAEG